MPGGLLPVIIVAISCVLALLPYATARRFLRSRIDEHTKDLAGSVIFRVGALHSLILALVFAQELVNFNEARRTMVREAALVGDVFYDLRRYDESETRSIQADLLEYTNVVLNREWLSLASSAQLDEQAWSEWDAAYNKVLDLEPGNARQQALKEIMLDRVRELSDLRIERESAALEDASRFFLYAAITGIVLISIGYFPFPPTAVNLTLLCIFGIYTGLVLYFIVAFSNPYSGDGYLEPTRFERLRDGMLNDF